MPCLITLPPLNPRYKVPDGCGIYIKARIFTWSRAAFSGLLAASLILATYAAPSASAFEVGGPGRPAIPAQGPSGRKTVIDVRTSPSVYLPGPAFRTEVYSLKPVSPRVRELLQRSIEQALLKNDPRLR